MQYDVDFVVPFRHRVRFTTDIAGEQFNTLLDLIEPSEQSPPKVLVVMDAQLAGLSSVAETLVSRLENAASLNLLDCRDVNEGATVDSAAYLMTGGEACKNEPTDLERLLELINHFDIDRRSYIVVIGGGAVLDAAGYAAAIAHRGIRLIRIPTTTLAQDDSGVGVKNAINYFNKKNWVGTFAVPWGVINDASILESLGDRDFCSGFSEAVKVSLLKSKTDFDFLCENADAIRRREMPVAFGAIQRACLWHLKHITQGGDPFESLEARPLDFGHWSAHRLEAMTDYRIRHGEAVGIGVALDCIYSHRVYGFPKSDLQRTLHCLASLGMPLWDPALDDADALLNGLEEFRQHLGGRLTVTMLKSVGEPINVHEVDLAEMRASVRDLQVLGQDRSQWAKSIPVDSLPSDRSTSMVSE